MSFEMKVSRASRNDALACVAGGVLCVAFGFLPVIAAMEGRDRGTWAHFIFVSRWLALVGGASGAIGLIEVFRHRGAAAWLAGVFGFATGGILVALFATMYVAPFAALIVLPALSGWLAVSLAVSRPSEKGDRRPHVDEERNDETPFADR